MAWKRYGHAALVGAAIAFGIVIAARIGNDSLGVPHIVVGCILTAIFAVKTTTVSLSR